MKKLPTILAGTLALASCGPIIDKEPVNNSMGAMAAKEFIDVYANMPEPRLCSEMRERMGKQSVRYIDDPEDISNPVEFADGRTLALLQMWDIEDSRRQIMLTFDTIDPNDNGAGLFIGSISVTCLK